MAGCLLSMVKTSITSNQIRATILVARLTGEIMNIAELRLAASAAGKKDTRYYLNGVCVTATDITASTGHIVCRVGTRTDMASVGRESIIIPIDRVELFLKMHGSKHGTLDIVLENNGPMSIKMVTAKDSLTFTPVDADYPSIASAYKRMATDSKYTDNQYDWAYIYEADKACKAFTGQKFSCILNQIEGMGWFEPTDDVTYIIMSRKS